MAVEGHADLNTQAWLCPRDPGPGETLGDEGRARLTALGCLDLGFVASFPAGTSGWSTAFDVNDLPADRVAGFPSGANVAYRLLLTRQSAGHGGTFSADVPAFDLRP